MSLNIRSKTYGGGDDSWLGSRHGVVNAQNGTLDATAFTGLTDNIVPSGTPVIVSGDKYVPAGETAPTGFVLGDHSIADGDTVVPIVWHGRILTQNLPVAYFPVPAAPGPFVYVGGTKGTDPTP